MIKYKRMSDEELIVFAKEHIEIVNDDLIVKKSWNPKVFQIGDSCVKNNHTYPTVCIKTVRYKAHKIVFGLVYNYIPKIIDHIDKDKSNFKIDNLREVTKSQNEWNRTKRSDNTSGYKGVWYHKQRNKWAAEITFHGKSHKLGLFLTPELAAEAYNNEAKKLHKEYAEINNIGELDD